MYDINITADVDSSKLYIATLPPFQGEGWGGDGVAFKTPPLSSLKLLFPSNGQ
jgi:hypothetical protein